MLVGAGLLTLPAACSHTENAGDAVDAGAAELLDSATSSISTNDHSTSASNAPDAAARRSMFTCRVIDATGTPDSLVVGGQVPNGWITIAAGGKLTVRHPRSTRESVFLGPAEVVPCVGAQESHWLRSGTFKSAPGSGEAPGHEAWVITPLGVVRYGVAGLTVQMDTRDAKRATATVTVASGSARVWHPSASGAVSAHLDKAAQKKSDAGAAGEKSSLAWTRLVDGTSMTLVASATHPGGAADAGQLDTSGDCFADAEIAAMAARALRPTEGGGGADAGDFGARAAHDLEAIEATRAACALATMMCPADDPSCTAKVAQRSSTARPETIRRERAAGGAYRLVDRAARVCAPPRRAGARRRSERGSARSSSGSGTGGAAQHNRDSSRSAGSSRERRRRLADAHARG